MKERSIVIVGGGLPGLFSALVCSEKFPNASIKVIERGPRLGGAYGSLVHRRAGIFDHGMHLIYTSMDQKIDKYFRECIPEDDWNILEGNEKDIAGVFYGGRLETKSPYINIADVKQDFRSMSINGLFRAFSKEPVSAENSKNALHFFQSRFGFELAETVFDPILQKLWGHKAEDLSAFISKLVLMDRVNFFPHEAMLSMSNSSLLRSRLAFPDQMRLPLEKRSSQVGLYPKKFGMKFFIEKIQSTLERRGVDFQMSTQINHFKISKGSIRSIGLIRDGKPSLDCKVDEIIWTIPIFSLSPLLNIQNSINEKGDPPKAQKCIYFLLKNPPNMDNLYYFFCFDSGFKTFRVTNYSQYCEDAVRKSESEFGISYPVCMEMHLQEDENINGEKLERIAKKELMQFGIIEKESDVLFCFSGEQSGGFPILTNKNIRIQADLKEQINMVLPKNLNIACQEPEKGIFFLHEVVTKIFYALD